MMLGEVQFISRRTYLPTVLSTPMLDHGGYSRSLFLECAADGQLALSSNILNVKILKNVLKNNLFLILNANVLTFRSL